MGITKRARTAAMAALDADTATNSLTKKQQRKYVAAMVDAGNEWLAKFDAQDSVAPAGFAASKQAQYDTYTAALPVIAIDLTIDTP